MRIGDKIMWRSSDIVYLIENINYHIDDRSMHGAYTLSWINLGVRQVYCGYSHVHMEQLLNDGTVIITSKGDFHIKKNIPTHIL